MNDSAYYYTLSTIPQIITAMAAIMVAVAYFRISALREYLIGEGRVALSRWGEKGYEFPDKKEGKQQRERMRDAVDRRNEPEIKNVLYRLAKIEAETHEATPPRGLTYVYEERFRDTEDIITQLQRTSSWLVWVSCVTIMTCIIPLADPESVATYVVCRGAAIWINVSLLLCVLLIAGRLLYISTHVRPSYETDRPVDEES